MKKVIVHIGSQETGEREIQHTLAINQEFLAENRIIYSGFHPAVENHIKLAYGLLKEALEKTGHLSEFPQLEKSDWNADRVLQEIFAEEGTTYVLSFEGLFSETYRALHGLDPRYDRELERYCNSYIREHLAEKLHQYADELILVCYLRRQDLLLEALYNGYIKEPWTDTALPEFEKFVEARPVHLDYYNELREWEQYFGKSEMIIRNYESEFLPHGVVHDFFENAVGLPFEKIMQLQKARWQDCRPALSRDALEAKKILAAKMKNKGLDELFRRYTLEHPQEKEYAYFSYSERMELLSRYEAGNARVAKEYLGRYPEPLFWNMNCLVETYQGLSKERFDEVMNWILEKLD